jgi:hypothetical protein
MCCSHLRTTAQGVLRGCLAVLLAATVGCGDGGKGKAPEPEGQKGKDQGKEVGKGKDPVQEAAKPIPVDPNPRVQVYFDDGGMGEGGRQLTNTMHFGVVALIDPKRPQEGYKKLTYDRNGATNTTVVRIDGKDRWFGALDGKWMKWGEVTEDGKTRKIPGIKSPEKWEGSTKMESVWMHDEGVQITQIVETIPGEPVDLPDGSTKRLLDTVLVRYIIENADKGKNHTVGLRFMLDTLIGLNPDGSPNDGVPFMVPGEPKLIDTFKDFVAPEPIPAFAQVLEKANPQDPGLVCFLNFKVGGNPPVEAPDRVSLTAWPGRSKAWDVPVQPMGKDSAVVLYCQFSPS